MDSPRLSQNVDIRSQSERLLLHPPLLNGASRHTGWAPQPYKTRSAAMNDLPLKRWHASTLQALRR